MENIVLVVKNNEFQVNGISYSLNDLYTIDFYTWSDSQVDKYQSENIFDNVAYLNIIMNVLAIQYLINNNKVTQVNVYPSNNEILCYTIDAAKLSGVPISLNGVKIHKKSKKIVRFVILIEEIYMLFLQLRVKTEKRIVDTTKDLCVIRTAAAKKKIHENNQREIFFEDKVGNGNFYSFFSLKERVKSLKKSYEYALKLLDKIICQMDNYGLDITTNVALYFFELRLLPVTFYGNILDSLMNMNWCGKFISGNNLDMYACIEERLAKKHKLKTVCIPHGLEYGFKLPHGFTGDVFYATSSQAANYLNNLYDTNKFSFSQEIADSMFKIKKTIVSQLKKNDKKVVFFSEPREAYVNILILKELVSFLSKRNIPLYIKHHPGDKLDDYNELSNCIITIDNFEDAIQGNICISRKSTILLEGTYNDAVCAAIIVNEKDNAIFHTFPSLSDQKIKEFHNIDSLCEWIAIQIEKN